MSGLTRRTAERDVVIVGSGPAGYTAAVYAARAGLRPLVFEGSQRGGELMTTTDVENFPGFPAGVQGPDLMQAMREQAERFGADLLDDDVQDVALQEPLKVVRGSRQDVTALAVVLATGSAPRYLGVHGEAELLGRGVSACATCDGYFFRGEDVAVVGGGDSAMEEALFLSRLARTVTVIHRREEFKASRIMLDRARATENVRFLTSSQVVEVCGDSRVRSLTVTTLEGGSRSLEVSGVFVAIGHDPRSELVKGQVALTESGHVVVEHPSTATSVPGVFAAGDLVDPTYRQAVTAAGSGCAAALDVERWLMTSGATHATP